MRKLTSILSFGAAMLVAGLLQVGPALADQIFICQSCSAPPGGDPNIITNTGAFNVGVAGSFTLQNPLLIIVADYNGGGAPSISFNGNPSVPLATIGTYGLTGNSGVSMTSGTAFAQLGLGAGGSESFVNFSAADVANGFAAPTSFSLYAFALNTNLTSGSPITIGESGAALGSFILGYSCNDGTGSSSGCKKNGDRAQTVFTNTGLLDGHQVPEPASLLLLGAGLAGIGIWRRKSAKS